MNTRTLLLFTAFAVSFFSKPVAAKPIFNNVSAPYFWWCIDISKPIVTAVGNQPGIYDVTFDFTTGRHNVNKSVAVVSSKDTVSQTIKPFVTEGTLTFRIKARSEKDIVIFTFIAEHPWDEPPCHVYDLDLPVTFSSFDAKKNDNTVVLSWKTASELNNKGFEIQRTATAGGWETIGFVESQAKALDGNSQTELSYQFIDNSTTRGLVFYQLKQIDRDGRFNYSKTVSIRNEEKSELKVFPNPVTNGTAQVQFEDINTLHNVSLFDINGKFLRGWVKERDVLSVRNLLPGVYILQIVNSETGANVSKKIIVQ